MWERFVLWLCRRIFGMTEYGTFVPEKPVKPKTMIRMSDGSYVESFAQSGEVIVPLSPTEHLRQMPDGSYQMSADDKTNLRRGIVGGIGCVHEWSPWSYPYSVYQEAEGSVEIEERFQRRKCTHCNTEHVKRIN
jgi:hypothetical protein